MPQEVERQAREFREQMEVAERAFGDAVRSIVIREVDNRKKGYREQLYSTVFFRIKQ